MQWETAKGDVALQGCDVKIDRVDGTPKAITIVSGITAMRVDLDCYSLRVSVPAKPKMVKRWRLNFKVCGVEHTQDFDDEYTAQNAADKTSGSVEEVEVPE